ncbi:unnamed protein product [Brassica rapa]|uniref:Uncharacterized protein n=1 Tax=Brassica campestris TaxID=3711 RepID=A0A8D9I6S3_BRACM|nr:unnamed protein product [Brassica rapa]
MVKKLPQLWDLSLGLFLFFFKRGLAIFFKYSHPSKPLYTHNM